VARAPLRIALVSETWPPDVNGVAYTLQRLVEGLRGRGHAVQVARPRRGNERSGARGDGDVLCPGLPIPMYPELRFGLPSRGLLSRRWRRRRPEVVHVATEGPLGWSALTAAERLGLPVTSSYHTRFDAYTRHYGWGWLAGWVEARLADFHTRCAATLVPGEETAARLETRGVPNVRRMARGVDPGRFDPARRSTETRARWGLGPDDVALICVGRLAGEKNLGLALQALAVLREERPGDRLVLVGDGPWRPRLVGVPGVVLEGARPQAEVGALAASADVFVFPSLTETFGNVLLEALASGLATVSFRDGASALHVRSGVNGLQRERGDDAGFVADVVRLAKDARLRAELGAAARLTALAVGWEPVVDTFETVLGDAAARRICAPSRRGRA
jgi:glycosyltransferase involved in cell wall biosynthesis